MSSDINIVPTKNFPPLLAEIPDPPKKLYSQGSLPDWKQYKLLTVVGTRAYTSYGKDVCENLIRGLSGFPIVIVSGLALGIDGIAHRAALRAKLPTIAVPGSGLQEDILYPSAHRTLAKEIVREGGALLSEFEPDFRATAWSFPQRNRIMAGMSHATLVVEAQKKSGTLITSRLATEYNRDVLTVPGSIFSKNSEGPHLLLSLGARPISQSVDILDALGFKIEEKTETSYHDCTAEELSVLEFLSEPRPRDEVIRASGLSAGAANALLTALELKGLITETLGELRRV